MTTSGHDALLITLLASLTACTGYAAGRLHQWYRTGLDRDEAYRDGYDTATRSVFTMAARLIGPRRGNRGPAITVPEVPVIMLPASSVAAGPPSVRPAVAPSGSVVTASSGPEHAGERRGSVAALSAGARQTTGDPEGPARRRGASPAAAESPATRPGDGPAPAADPAGPKPVAAPRSPAVSVSGVLRASRSPAATPTKGTGPSAGVPGGSEQSPAADGDAGGRHLVLDELVTAPTYRLTPDRVARAKVREAPDDDEGQETTRLPSVPRPRSS